MYRHMYNTFGNLIHKNEHHCRTTLLLDFVSKKVLLDNNCVISFLTAILDLMYSIFDGS